MREILHGQSEQRTRRLVRHKNHRQILGTVSLQQGRGRARDLHFENSAAPEPYEALQNRQTSTLQLHVYGILQVPIPIPIRICVLRHYR